ncbi:DinB family protein [Pseudotenacibaculum sp. MALMAid0570]|uniref:DinB family protein n=1 Tax=Pseudotenacibaculum sp. MALMAid0570 TaxID=3143938 RepID=UPI0032E02197
MRFETEKLLDELTEHVHSHLQFSKSLDSKSDEELNWRPHKKSWSVLECLEHLNRYGKFYIEEIKKRMENSKAPQSNIFESGRWGNKFAMDMLPKEGMKTMKTFKSKNPLHSKLDREKVVATFTKQQHWFLRLLEMAKEKDLTKIKTSTTLPLVKFRLGDTFRFVIHHNERHVQQARKILSDK